MPPHLHPRSSATTTLFASTLAASFIIVGIPHLFPCPAPRKSYLDAQGNLVLAPRRRRRSRTTADHEENSSSADERVEQRHENQIEKGAPPTEGLEQEIKSVLGLTGATETAEAGAKEKVRGRTGDGDDEVRILFQHLREEAVLRERDERKCPVPKPRGKMGELLGFGRDGRGRRADDESR